MGKTNLREVSRKYRHKRIRRISVGTNTRPRMCVHRSASNMFVQLIDDNSGKVLAGMSTLNKEIKSKIKFGGNINAASILGKEFSGTMTQNGYKQVCFDRGGYLYHGRIKAFAEAAREGGLEF